MRIARYWALLDMVLFPHHTGVTVFGFFPCVFLMLSINGSVPFF
jgi:hypothetical protein